MYKKPSLKILSIFNVIDRLDELDEVPNLLNGEPDYWFISKLLCKKDGGRLPTMEELAEIASYIYQTDFKEFDSKYNLNLKNKLIPYGHYWSSSIPTFSGAYIRYFGSTHSNWNKCYNSGSSNSFIMALCVAMNNKKGIDNDNN